MARTRAIATAILLAALAVAGCAAHQANSGTITFDLVQWYHGEDAAREAAKDLQESPPPNDYYIRNVNHKLRTLPTAADATITVNNLLHTQQPTPVTLAKLATLTHDRSPIFWITVRHGQVLRISEQWVP